MTIFSSSHFNINNSALLHIFGFGLFFFFTSDVKTEYFFYCLMVLKLTTAFDASGFLQLNEIKRIKKQLADSTYYTLKKKKDKHLCISKLTCV